MPTTISNRDRSTTTMMSFRRPRPLLSNCAATIKLSPTSRLQQFIFLLLMIIITAAVANGTTTVATTAAPMPVPLSSSPASAVTAQNNVTGEDANLLQQLETTATIKLLTSDASATTTSPTAAAAMDDGNYSSSTIFPSSPEAILPQMMDNNNNISFFTTNFIIDANANANGNNNANGIDSANGTGNGNGTGASPSHGHARPLQGDHHFQLVSLNWEHVQTPFGLSLWLLLASIAKILFNMNRRLAEAVPDSALLIVLGLALGCLLQLLQVDSKVFSLSANTFFLYLLPPIIFDAGYFMPNRQLFDNLDSVLLFAFVGTVWNTLAIGFSLLWLSQAGIFSVPFSAFQILLFASLISAVDPVAVIAVFEQIHINEFLFINVFGEALFNDGVSVVLYQMFRKFRLIGEHNLRTADFVAGMCSFLVIALGGILIGLCFAVVACLATKGTTQVRILAPVFVFVVPYLAYLTAELFGLSSILAIVACGIAMKQYVKGNLSHDANSSVKYFVKMLAQCSETVIFLFLGLSAVSRDHHWDWAFIGATIGLCLLHRVIGVVVQCSLLNRFRTKRFSFADQFVLSYGGLRGAIAFGLVVALDDNFPAKQMFVSCCIAVIFFTVFVQGITIRPLLSWLKVEKEDMEREETMIEKIYSRYCDYMMTGVEDIAGLKGKNSLRDAFERFNSSVLMPVLMRDEPRKPFDTSSIVRAYKRITLVEAQCIIGEQRRMRRPKQMQMIGVKAAKRQQQHNNLHRVGPVTGQQQQQMTTGTMAGQKKGTAKVTTASGCGSSSTSSTMTDNSEPSQCWTTTTTTLGLGAATGDADGRRRRGEAAEGVETCESRASSSAAENAITDSQQHSPHPRQQQQQQPPPQQPTGDIGQPAAEHNTEQLCAMFSLMLERKIAELREIRRPCVVEEREEDDIKDDYLLGTVQQQQQRRSTSVGGKVDGDENRAGGGGGEATTAAAVADLLKTSERMGHGKRSRTSPPRSRHHSLSPLPHMRPTIASVAPVHSGKCNGQVPLELDAVQYLSNQLGLSLSLPAQPAEQQHDEDGLKRDEEGRFSRDIP